MSGYSADPNLRDYRGIAYRAARLAASTLMCIVACALVLLCLFWPASGAREPDLLFASIVIGVPLGIGLRLSIEIVRIVFGVRSVNAPGKARRATPIPPRVLAPVASSVASAIAALRRTARTSASDIADRN